MRQLLLSLQLSILNYCVKKGGRKREGREERREEEREGGEGKEDRREEGGVKGEEARKGGRIFIA